jgi:hypothetical protein
MTLRVLEVILMTGMLRVPRTRGVGSGTLLVLLGAWGALVPFIGPYFHFGYTPDTAWAWTWGRFFLEVLPGVAAVLGGLILLISAFRPVAMAGAILAAAGGAWFAAGTLFAPLWTNYAALGVRTSVPAALSPGTATGGPLHVMAEHLAYFTGLGVVIVFLAAAALGRLAVIGARDVEIVTSRGTVPEEEPARAATVPASAAPADAGADGEQPKTSVFRRLTSARAPSSDS